VQIYDSLFDTIDSRTKDTVFDLFESAAIPELVTVPKQTGNKNCGVFALAYRMNPAATKQDVMRLPVYGRRYLYTLSIGRRTSILGRFLILFMI